MLCVFSFNFVPKSIANYNLTRGCNGYDLPAPLLNCYVVGWLCNVFIICLYHFQSHHKNQEMSFWWIISAPHRIVTGALCLWLMKEGSLWCLIVDTHLSRIWIASISGLTTRLKSRKLYPGPQPSKQWLLKQCILEESVSKIAFTNDIYLLL